MYHSLNPRFDGAFLNFKDFFEPVKMACLNPRFDGAFLNCELMKRNFAEIGS